MAAICASVWSGWLPPALPSMYGPGSGSESRNIGSHGFYPAGSARRAGAGLGSGAGRTGAGPPAQCEAARLVVAGEVEQLVRRSWAERGSGAGRIGEAARRDGARLRAGPQHGSAGRCETGRTGAGSLVQCEAAGRGAAARPARWERGQHRQPRCARVHRPHRAHPSAPPRLSIACPSAPCAAVGPEGAEAVRNSEQDRVLTIEPARPRLGGDRGGSPPSPSKVARRSQPRRSARARRPAARVRRAVGPLRASV